MTKVWFSLCKNGRETESGTVKADGTPEDKIFAVAAYIESGVTSSTFCVNIPIISL
ncbi:hypothetical protein [Methanosarcina spelaei]|uniref:hypothetical protein n=1 Tax=Methanosarcina spelaei TaxID=1036679 RepID=UPI0014838296|nr:hypothetical protein [Methanosarcina spelaei]